MLKHWFQWFHSKGRNHKARVLTMSEESILLHATEQMLACRLAAAQLRQGTANSQPNPDSAIHFDVLADTISSLIKLVAGATVQASLSTRKENGAEEKSS